VDQRRCGRRPALRGPRPADPRRRRPRPVLRSVGWDVLRLKARRCGCDLTAILEDVKAALGPNEAGRPGGPGSPRVDGRVRYAPRHQLRRTSERATQALRVPVWPRSGVRRHRRLPRAGIRSAATRLTGLLRADPRPGSQSSGTYLVVEVRGVVHLVLDEAAEAGFGDHFLQRLRIKTKGAEAHAVGG